MIIDIPELSDVEKICNTSVYDAGITIRNCTDVDLLKRAIKHEFDHGRRVTMIRMLGRRVRKLVRDSSGPDGHTA